MRLLIFLALVLAPASAFAETAYERVISTDTLRCGYGIFPPFTVKDPNTGELSGAFVEIMDRIGSELGIKIEYVEEVDWGQIPQALKANRIDAMCAAIWGTAKRGKYIGFTVPVFYSSIEAFVRADDKRFDNNLERINRSDVRIATNDGDASEEIADMFFPEAQQIAKGTMTGEEILYMNVVSNKADITFSNYLYVADFLKASPGTLRRVELDRPLRVNKNVIGVDIHEHELLNMLNAAIEQLHNSGVTDTILDKYVGDAPGAISRAAYPYR